MDAAEVMQHGVMWLDKDGNILGVNSQFVDELGYVKPDFARKTIFQVNPNTTLIQWRKLWQQLLDQKQIALETEHMTAQGTIYPVRLRGVLMQADGENFCFGIVENLLDKQRYHHLLQMTEQISRTGSWEWNLEHNTILLSAGMQRLLNIPGTEELSAEKAEEMLQQRLPEPEFAALKSRLKQCVQTGEPLETELNMSGNRALRIHLHAKPIHTEGRTYKVLGIMQDLSGVSGRTDELYLMQFCIDQAYEMINWLSADGAFVYVNEAICEKLGYTRNELLDMKLQEIEHHFSSQKWQQRWHTLKKNKNLETEQMRLTKDGRSLHVQVWANYVSFKGQEYCVEFARDLTKKKERDEIIELSHYTLNQANDFICWFDYSGNFIYFNEAMLQKLGYREEELRKMALVDLLPELGSADFARHWARMQAGETIAEEYQMQRKNDSEISVNAVISLIQFGGNELGCAILRDISARKRKEEELQQQLAENEKLRQQLEEENVFLKEEIKLEHIFTNIISKSKKYKRILQEVEQVADTNATVLIMGETGTGKELLAKAIHQLSDRADRPMVKVNCGALPKNLIESELFGHEKGAFTGAYKRKTGRFEAAHRGTLFLDEVGELPLDLQVKLLRVLQEKEFERVGGSETICVDVRVVAATNRNLEALVQQGRFRQDLYYRLNVFPIFNLPLRERMEDVPLLVRHFVEKYNQQLGKSVSEIPQHLLDELLQYDFPGNVRELENIVERGMILSNNKQLKLDLSFRKSATMSNHTFKTLEEMQREHIIEALSRTRGQVSGNSGAAKLLNLNPKTLTSRMKKLGIDRMDYLQK